MNADVLWIVFVYAAMFGMAVFGARRISRLTDAELHRTVGTGSTTAALVSPRRAPKAWVLAAGIGLVMALAILAYELTHWEAARFLAIGAFFGWCVGVCVAVYAGLRLRPAFLVEPRLRQRS